MKIPFFSLIRPKRIYRHHLRLYRKKASRLSSDQKLVIQNLLKDLQSAILQKQPENAKLLAEKLEKVSHEWMPKTTWDRFRDFVLSLAFALAVAIVIRQTWFEFYSIPSGSMRPTLKEKDYVLVSKTDFGINTLTPTSHLYFDPDLIKRGEVVIFSVSNMDVPNPDEMYFYIIPGKKQYVKRLFGKPGDTLYFYGGRIYGIDRNGNDILDLREGNWVQSLEHIPFIHFEVSAFPSK